MDATLPASPAEPTPLDQLEGSALRGVPAPTRRVIVESPYAGDVAENQRYLSACLRDCILRGETPYASHGLLTRDGVLNDDDPAERALGMRACHAMRRGMQATVVYVDRGISPGMREAIADAESIGQQVEHRRLGGEWAS